MNQTIIDDIIDICKFSQKEELIIVLCFDHPQADYMLKQFVDEVPGFVEIQPTYNEVTIEDKHIKFIPFKFDVSSYRPTRVFMDAAVDNLLRTFYNINNMIRKMNHINGVEDFQ